MILWSLGMFSFRKERNLHIVTRSFVGTFGVFFFYFTFICFFADWVCTHIILRPKRGACYQYDVSRTGKQVEGRLSRNFNEIRRLNESQLSRILHTCVRVTNSLLFLWYLHFFFLCCTGMWRFLMIFYCISICYVSAMWNLEQHSPLRLQSPISTKMIIKPTRRPTHTQSLVVNQLTTQSYQQSNGLKA